MLIQYSVIGKTKTSYHLVKHIFHTCYWLHVFGSSSHSCIYCVYYVCYLLVIANALVLHRQLLRLQVSDQKSKITSYFYWKICYSVEMQMIGIHQLKKDQ